MTKRTLSPGLAAYNERRRLEREQQAEKLVAEDAPQEATPQPVVTRASLKTGLRSRSVEAPAELLAPRKDEPMNKEQFEKFHAK